MRLPDREAELLRLRYGINRPEPMTLSAAARSMGVTRDTARGIERRAVAAVGVLGRLGFGERATDLVAARLGRRLFPN
jgi:DNA-directed RNA polymerase sigma subunit (sigma70/sigma32)